MNVKSIFLFLAFLSFFSFSVVSQTDFRKELKEHFFRPVQNDKVPLEILNIFGYDSYNYVGTKQTEKGCTSGKRIVIDWVSKDLYGFYVLSISSCGWGTSTSYYIVSNGKKHKIELDQKLDSFDDFKLAYLKD